MGFKMKMPKIKIKVPKKTLNQIGNVATGAVTGAVMGGPFGAAAGAVGGSMQSAKKFNPVKSVVQGGIAGGAVGAYKGTGVAGKYIAPKAKELGSKAVGLFRGDSGASAVSAIVAPVAAVAAPGVGTPQTPGGPFNLESVKAAILPAFGMGTSEASAAEYPGAASQSSNYSGIILLAVLAGTAIFLLRR